MRDSLLVVVARANGPMATVVKSAARGSGPVPAATLAQLVEHTLGKGEVVGSSPMGGFGIELDC